MIARAEVAVLLESWKPTIPHHIHRYVTADKNEVLRQACEHLNVAMIAAPILGHTRRSIGAAVAAADSTRSWIKVTGRYDSLADPSRDHEIRASSLIGLPKPEVMAHIDWQSAGIHWLALQMTLAPAPVVEVTPWSGLRAHAVTRARDWLSSELSLETKYRDDIVRVPFSL